MAGNPYHDAAGKFCAKDTAIESYEKEISEAIQSGNTERAQNLQTDYENMMIEADPQSEVAQKALQRDYGTFAQKVRSDTVKKMTREQKKAERQLLKSDKNTQKLTDKFDQLYNKYKELGYSEKGIKEMFYSNGHRDLFENQNLYHPDKVVKPVGEFKEVPVSEVQEGDIITVSMYPNTSGPANFTARIKSGGSGKYICLHNEKTRMNSNKDSYIMGKSIEDVRNSNHNGAAIIRKVVRDQGAKDFLKDEAKFKQERQKKEAKLKELEEQKRKLEQEINSARGY